MIEIINPFTLYALSFIGALGIIWILKYSNNLTLRKLAPMNNLRQSIALIILTNFLVLIYLIIHAKFISKMLIDPGLIRSSGGSGGGFFWNDNLGVWNQQKLNNFKFFKFIKELAFVFINIFVFLLALFLRKKNNSKITTEITKKPNLAFTVLLIFFSLLLTYITLGAILLTLEEYFIWQGG
jgi:hypothetical protein